MKLAILTLTLIPIMGWAEVSDFNSLINENAKAQRELQHNIEDKTTTVKAELTPKKTIKKTVIVQSESYNVPTNDRALKFNKELHQDQPSNKKELDRLAEEFKSMDREF
jgi:hypothetical protein